METHILISCLSWTTYFAILSQSFLRSWSSSSGMSALILASSKSPFSSARSTLFSQSPILE